MDISNAQPLIGMPSATILGSPVACSSDGVTFLQVYGTGSSPQVATFPQVYAVDDQRTVKRVDFRMPASFKVSSLRSLFAGHAEVVILIQATQPLGDTSVVRKGQRVPFLSVTGLQDGLQMLIPLDLPFEPVQVASLESSSQFLVLGVDTANQIPVLAVLDKDGSLDKKLQLDVNTYLQSQELKDIYTKNPETPAAGPPTHGLMDSLRNAQFVAAGDDVLLIQPGTQNPVYRFRSDGRQDQVTLHLPKRLLLQQLLGTDKRDSWVVLAGSNQSLQKVENGGVVENAAQDLYEVDPTTGEVLDQLLVKGPQSTEVSCAAHGKLSSIYYGGPAKDGAEDQLTYASASR